MATGEVVTRLLQQHKHPEHGYRACLGLLSLAKRYGNARLEAACELALALGACTVPPCARHPGQQPRPRPTGDADAEWISPTHANLRGPATTNDTRRFARTMTC